MAQGLERRDSVKNTVPVIQPQAAAVPLGMVASPQPASAKGIGEEQRVFAALLGDGSKLFDNFMEKQQAKWELDGQLAYAAGKSREEIAKTGNTYTLAGFTTLETAAAANTWMATQRQRIQDEAHQIEPEQYGEELKSSFSELLDASGNDPVARELLMKQAGQFMPELMGNQVLANNEWKKHETKNSWGNYLDSIPESTQDTGAAIEMLREATSAGASGLPKADEDEVIEKAILRAYERGDETISKAAITDRPSDEAVISARPRGLMQAIAQVESGGNYNVANGNRPVQFTDMTINEVISWQREDQKTNGSKSAAAGAYQFMPDTLEEEMKRAGFTGDEKFSEAVQDQLFMSRANYRGLGAFARGEISADAFMRNLAAEWRSLPADMAGNNYDPTDKGNRVLMEPGALMGLLEGTVTNASLAESLRSRGMSPEAIERIRSAQSKLADKRAEEFNAGRVLLERDMIKTVETSGDLAGGLSQIQSRKEELGLSDAWANKMANQMVSAAKSYEDNYKKQADVRSALSTGTLGSKDPSAQKAGMELVRKEAIAYLNTQEHLPLEEKVAAVQDKVRKTAIQNNIVDDVTANTIESALSGEVLNRDGTIKPQALSAYGEVRKLIAEGGVAYASKYFGKAADFIHTAIAYDDGSSDSTSALMLAKNVDEQRKAGTFKEPTLNMAAVAEQADKLLDSVEPSFMHYLSYKEAIPSGLIMNNLYDDEHDRLRNNEQLKTIIKMEAVRHLTAYPGMPEKAAVEKAAAVVADKVEFVGGHVLMSGPSTTIREDMGFKGSNIKNHVEAALFEFVAAKKSKLWPTYRGPKQTLMQKVGNLLPGEDFPGQDRGVPELASVRYDHRTKTFLVDMWADESKTEVLGQPRPIPAAVVGQWWNDPDNVQRRMDIGARTQTTAFMHEVWPGAKLLTKDGTDLLPTPYNMLARGGLTMKDKLAKEN